jgi:hypothetical protein
LLDRWHCGPDARDLRLRLRAAADHTERAGAFACEVLRRNPARSSRAQSPELIGLDHGERLVAHGIEENDDESGARPAGGIRLDSGYPEPEVGGRHQGQHPVVEA